MNLSEVLYIAIIVPSFILFGYCCYLLYFEAPSTMNKYTYMLFIIAVSALAESFYFGIVMMPSALFVPFPLFYTNGLMTMWTDTSVGFQWGISTVLHGQIVGSIADAIFYRYWVVMTSTGSKIWKFAICALAVFLHFLSSGVCTPLSAYAFLDDAKTRKLLRKDQSYPKNLGALMGPSLYPWVFTLAVLITMTAIIISIFLYQMNTRLKQCALSPSTKKMHRELIFGLLLIINIVALCAGLPTGCLASYFIFGSLPYVEEIAQVGFPIFAAKSLGSGIIIIVTVPQFRRHLPRLLRITQSPLANPISVAPVSVSGGTDNAGSRLT